MADLNKLEAVAWMIETRDERWLAFEHEDPDAIAIPFTETPLTDLTRANEIIAEKEAEIARLREAARNIIPYLIWTVGPESPGCHPTMPSAVGAFQAALKEPSQ